MSVNRENLTWQSADGTWNIAFYDFYETGDTSDPDFDYEWDVEYTDDFNFVSMGHGTEEKAYEAYTRNHANPGGTTVYPWAGNEEHNAALDVKAREFIKSTREARCRG